MDEDRAGLDVQVQCLKGRKGRRRYLKLIRSTIPVSRLDAKIIHATPAPPTVSLW